MKGKDSVVYLSLRKVVINEIDNNLKTMLVLRAQEVKLPIKTELGEIMFQLE